MMKKSDMKRAKRYLKMIRDMHNSKQSQNLLKVAPAYVINAISEVLYNMLLNENMHLTPGQKAILRQHRLLISRIGSHKNNIKKRRDHIVKYKQKGGFIGAILPLITTILGEALA